MDTCFLIKKPKLYNGKKESIFNKWCWSNWMSARRRNANRSISITLYTTQVQVVQRPQYKPDTLNLTEEKMENSLQHNGLRNNSLNRTSFVQVLRSTINKWNFMKLKSFYKAKDMVKRINSSLQNGKRSSPTLHLTEG